MIKVSIYKNSVDERTGVPYVFKYAECTFNDTEEQTANKYADYYGALSDNDSYYTANIIKQ